MKQKISDFRDDIIASTCNWLLRRASPEYFAFVTVIVGLGRDALDEKVEAWALEETK